METLRRVPFGGISSEQADSPGGGSGKERTASESTMKKALAPSEAGEGVSVWAREG